ncbi:tail fiber domain-containing protein [bacterium]|nr:tail fiber domain-containing protein [bacterium]
MIADGTIVNADVNASAAIAHSKLATITAGYVLIGNASNVPTATQVTGDVTISSTGVTAISSGVIVNADIAANAEIAVSKLANGTANQVIVTDGTNVSWSDDLTLAGNLTVNGTTTNINTQNLVVEDKNIILGDVPTPSDTTADGGGITLKGATDKTINWVDATDAWTSSERFSVPLGSAASPSLTFTGDENTGIYSPGADQVAISTGGSGRLFVDASGNVGVATSSPQALFDINGGFYRSVRYGNGGAIQLDGAGGTISSPAAINSSQLIGVVQARGYDGSSYRVGANITISTDGAVTSTSSPAYVSVATTPSGSTTPQERLRITSAGFVGIGTTSPTSRLDVAGYTKIGNYTGTFQGLSLQNNNDSSSAETVSFLDSLNNLGTIDSNIFFGHQTDGASYIALGTTPAGSRSSDRRVERVRITGSGNVGIGTASPQATLDVQGAVSVRDGSSYQWRSASGGTDQKIWDVYADNTSGNTLAFRALNDAYSAGYAWLAVTRSGNQPQNIIFYTGAGSERARIDSSGRLLVGTSSARGDHVFQIEGSNYELSSPRFTRFGDNAVSPGVVLAKTRGTTAGSNTIVNAEDRLGRLEFQGTDGTATRTAALIDVFVDGTPGTNDMPGRLVFSTTADGASSPTERMRIDNTGSIRTFGATNAEALAVSTATVASTFVPLIIGRHTASSTGGGTNAFIVWSGGNVVNTNNSYGAISDAKLKENIVDATSQWSDIKALQVRKYNFKEGQTHTQIGLIAQEVELVSPGLVSESPDRDAEGNDLGTVTKGVNYSVLYMKAVKALQEAMLRIEDLEARLDAANL